MTARTCIEVINAMAEVRKLQRTPYDIAKEAGLSPSTLYRFKGYKEFKAECEAKGIQLPKFTDPAFSRKDPNRKTRGPKPRKNATPDNAS